MGMVRKKGDGAGKKRGARQSQGPRGPQREAESELRRRSREYLPGAGAADQT